MKSIHDAKLDIWKVGSSFAEHLGSTPSSFSILIRGLCVDAARNGDCISQYNEASMLRLLKGASMAAPFYYILKTFKKETLCGQTINLIDIVRQFRALELASYLGLLIAYRQAKKIIKDEKEWELISELVCLRSEIGALVGYHLPICEPELGILAGGMRYLAWASFLEANGKAYQEYRRNLKKNNTICDPDFETKTWGCTAGTIVAHRLISLGFNKELAISIGTGLMLSDLPDRYQNPGEYSVKLIDNWVNALVFNGEAPELSEEERFSVDKDKVSLLLDEAHLSISTGSQFHWLTKGKKDISPEASPELNFNEIMFVSPKEQPESDSE
jgi:hypothetical protein